jgi:hypothetical protein
MLMTMSIMMSANNTTLLSFPRERPVFQKEYIENLYGPLSYFSAKTVVEMFFAIIQALITLSLPYCMVGLSGDFGLMFLTLYILSLAGSSMSVSIACWTSNPAAVIVFSVLNSIKVFDNRKISLHNIWASDKIIIIISSFHKHIILTSFIMPPPARHRIKTIIIIIIITKKEQKKNIVS